MNKISELSIASNKLSSRLVSVNSAVASLSGQKTQYISEVFEANKYLSAKNDILSFLHDLQTTVQEKEITSIENLLTSLVNEVIPSNNDRVRMSTKVENNRIHLDVNIVSNGTERNVFKDKGGSIHNILSLGLRFITLNKSINRRFIVLDEADTGIKADYMQFFAKVMHELSVKTNTQVIYISHHPQSYFKDYAKIIELSSKGNTIYSDVISDIDSAGSTPDYFKSLRLINFRQHKNTLIELSPFVNVIIGDNDIGKSTILESITSLLENLPLKSSIRDGSDEQQVELVDAEDQTYTWYHHSNKSKRKYTLHAEDGALIQDSSLSKGTPEWLDDFLMMPLVAGVNLHTVKQFKSHFIIGDEFSGTKKAELLSFGKEVKELNKMISSHTARVKRYQETVRTRQTDINSLNEKIQSYMPFLSHEENIKKIEDAVVEIQHGFTDIGTLSQLVENINSGARKAIMPEKITPLKVISSKGFVNLSSLSKSIYSWEELIELQKKNSMFVGVNTYSSFIIDSELIALAHTLQQISSVTSLQGNQAAVELDTIEVAPSASSELQRLMKLINHAESTKGNVIALKKENNKMATEKESLQTSLDHIKKSLPNKCPTCKQVVNYEL